MFREQDFFKCWAFLLTHEVNDDPNLQRKAQNNIFWSLTGKRILFYNFIIKITLHDAEKNSGNIRGTFQNDFLQLSCFHYSVYENGVECLRFDLELQFKQSKAETFGSTAQSGVT